MADTTPDERLAQATKALDDVLVEGDRFLVRRVEGSVLVTPAEDDEEQRTLRARMRESNPGLYAELATASGRISNAGSGLVGWSIVLGVGLCIALYLGALDGLIGPEAAAALRSGWLCVLFVVALAIVASKVSSYQGGRAYRRQREDVLAAVERAGVSREALIADLQGDPGVGDLMQHLTREPEADAGMSFR